MLIMIFYFLVVDKYDDAKMVQVTAQKKGNGNELKRSLNELK